jgi:hypothetical protein
MAQDTNGMKSVLFTSVSYMIDMPRISCPHTSLGLSHFRRCQQSRIAQTLRELVRLPRTGAMPIGAKARAY